MTHRLQDLASAVTRKMNQNLDLTISLNHMYLTIRVLDGTIYERRITCHLNVEQ